MEPKLSIELVPKSCFYTNVRSNVSREEWDKIRKQVYKKANYRCEICGGQGNNHPVECHEVWEYDDMNHIQKLIGMVALCPNCHQVKHIGLAGIRGSQNEAIKHLRKINQWDKNKANEYMANCFKIWSWRNQFAWKLDISLLSDY